MADVSPSDDRSGTADGPRPAPFRSFDQIETMLANLNEAIWSIDAKSGMFLYGSAGTERLYGCTREEFLAPRLWFDRIHPEDVQRLAAEETKVYAGEPWRGEFRIARPDGGVRWARATVLPVFESGELTRIDGIASDITEYVEATEALRRSEEQFRVLVQHASDIIMLVDADGLIRYTSPAITRILGYDVEALIGTPVLRLVEREDREQLLLLLDQTKTGGQVSVDLRARRAEGGVRHLEVLVMPMSVDDGGSNFVINARDVTERIEARLEMERSGRYFRALVQNGSDTVWTFDADGIVSYVSPSVERLLGYTPEELIGKDGYDLLLPDDRQSMRELMPQTRIPAMNPSLEFRVLHKDGSVRYLEAVISDMLDDPAVRARVINARDVTERRQYEEEIARRAFYDDLTGLPNRALLIDRIAQGKARSAAQGDRAAVLSIDLDRFKLVNDSLGRDAGDVLLAEVGQRLRGAIAPTATLARTGEDEFAVVLEGVSGVGDAIGAADDVLAALTQPFPLQDREFFITASVGIAVGGPDDSPDDLLRNAGLALGQAKADGKARHAIFRANMDVEALGRLRIETDLRGAAARGELRLYYQPIVLLRTGRIVGMEALVRWEHPEFGLMPPSEFVPLAEETGLILDIGQWVLREACRQTRTWQLRYPTDPPLSISVNLSPREFQQPDLATQISDILNSTDLSPDALVVEVTESDVMTNVDAAIEALNVLKQLGVRVAIDDFGKGYSSLAYLKRLPVDILKIDKTFVDGLGHDPKDTHLVRAMVRMAKDLGMKPVAEGVEVAEQATVLRALGCDHAQGYYFARPASSDSAEQFHSDGQRLNVA